MINNRQNGRRRGRGGQQARSGQPGGQDRGNRIDNRARGNAAQLLEKYKNLAGEAQRQGDRVNTEYYLQFADHYFRVLSESRARFEEQRPRREDREDGGREDYGADGDYAEEGQRFESRNGAGDNWNENEEDGFPARQQPERQSERQPERQSERRPEQPRYEERAAREDDGRRPRRPRNSNGAGNGNGYHANGSNGHEGAAEEQSDSRIEIDRLPAGFGAQVASEGEPVEAVTEEAAPRRRRAPRRPREEAPVAEA